MRSAISKVKNTMAQGRVRAHLVGGNPESFIGKHFVGWVGFQEKTEVWGADSGGVSRKWLSIYKLRKRTKSLYFTIIS